MLRSVVAACTLAACGVNVGTGGDNAADADPQADGSAPPVDAPVDARPCTGGDQSMTAPDGSCFLLFTTPRVFTDAKALCEASAAHLAVLTDAGLDTAAEAFVGTLDTYIGLTDLAAEGTFVWDDGTPLAFANFNANEPNNSGGGGYQEDCAIIAGARAGKRWDDRPCAPVPNIGGGLYAVLCQF